MMKKKKKMMRKKMMKKTMVTTKNVMTRVKSHFANTVSVKLHHR